MAKQKIVSIEIELKDYEPIKFTMDEAKELHEQLDALFGEKVKHIHHNDYWWHRPYYTWYNASNTAIPCSNLTTTISSSDLVGKSIASSTTNMKVSYKAA